MKMQKLIGLALLLSVGTVTISYLTDTVAASSYPSIWTDYQVYGGRGYVPMWIQGSGWDPRAEVRLIFYGPIAWNGIGIPIAWYTVSGYEVRADGSFCVLVAIPGFIPGVYSIKATQGFSYSYKQATTEFRVLVP